MELKYLVVLSVLGAVSGFTSSYTGTGPSSSATREKRDLLFKKYKKGKGESFVVNREYEHGVEAYDVPGRDVHHHHYSQYPQAPSYVEHRWEPRLQQQYNHYQGYNEGSYAGGYSAGYSGGNGYYSKPNYGNGGYAQYGNGGNTQQQPDSSVGAAPAATGQNSVDRGQGAAAVNNIAIIHARAGSSSASTTHAEESKLLPRPMSVNFDDLE